MRSLTLTPFSSTISDVVDIIENWWPADSFSNSAGVPLPVDVEKLCQKLNTYVRNMQNVYQKLLADDRSTVKKKGKGHVVLHRSAVLIMKLMTTSLQMSLRVRL